ALSRAPQDVVFGVVPKTAQRYARSDRFGFCRDQGIDAAPLEGTIDLRVRISGIGGNRLNIHPSGPFYLRHLRCDPFPLLLFFSPVVTSTSRVTPILSSTAVCCL